MARLLHYLYHAVEAHTVLAVRESRVEVGIERTGGGKGVALYTGYLYQSAYRVAGHAEVMLQSHLSCILYLGGAAAEELTSRSAGHGAGHAHLALTAHVGTRDGGILLDQVAYETRRGQGVQDAAVGELVPVRQVVEPAGTTPHAPQVGAVTMVPPEAFSSLAAKA